MPREFSRTLRVGEQIRRELAELIRKVKDPRVGNVTFGEVEVSKDLAHAKVYFTVLGGGAEQARESAQGLNHAAGFLRRELGRVMRLRIVPELRFVYDDTQEKGARLSALIDQAVRADRERHGPDGEGEAD